MRILNVANFNWMTGAERNTVKLSLFDICRKFSLAATRADHLVVEFADRAVARQAAPFRLKRLGAGWTNRRFLQVVDELKPDLILLHFADAISNTALREARRLSPGVVIADINIDPVWTTKNRKRLAMRKGYADALFVTTAEPALAANVSAGAFAAFLPNPVDPAIEIGRVFETETLVDVIFPCGDEEMREIGSELVSPGMAIERLRAATPGIRLSTPGLAGEPEVRGASYFDALHGSRMGWALSRRSGYPLYSSDRTAHFFGSGLTVLLDHKTGFDRFYGRDEAVYYSDLEDLAGSIRHLKGDDDLARDIARRGWEKTWRLFRSDRILDYVLAQLFNEGGAHHYEWPCDRWDH